MSSDAGGRATVASGEVSVIPHAWTTCTPYFSSKISIRVNGHGGATAGNQAERGDVVAGVGLHEVQHVVPDRRDRACDGWLLGIDEPYQRLGLQEPVRHEKVGTCHEGGIDQSPGVGMEHRHNSEDPVIAADCSPSAAQAAIECR